MVVIHAIECDSHYSQYDSMVDIMIFRYSHYSHTHMLNVWYI